MNIHQEKDDAIKAERIACTCRKCDGPKLVPGSGGHRCQLYKISEGLCVIERPYRLKR